ncbi:PAS domain S-box protein [Mucilaginibacter sp.]|uniref:PAS domain S-box protein n=1 Tax=Mucilaginibacter sp. TaxID=1882438 RepID=UPI0028432ED2|nr:PAS domain S-box protein [Mucilaginibacter sp.]MDR3695085.1 PAS domain S-box protein [Mucilaginibacter sp.]
MKIKTDGILFKRLSIQQRLPLLICALLLFSIIVYGFANYYCVRKASLIIGQDRLNSLTDQMGSMFGQSALVLLNTANSTAAQGAVLQCLKSNGNKFRKETIAALDKLHNNKDWISTTLVNANGVLILRSDSSKKEIKINLPDVIKQNKVGPNSTRIGMIYNINGTMYYPIITAVTEKKQIMGYIISWVMLSTTRKEVTQFSRLLGTGAAFYIVNSDGSLWTDLVKPVKAKLAGINPTGKIMEYTNADGKPVMASAKNIAGTAWLVMVEFPKENLLASLSNFVKWIFGIGVVLLAVGIFATWMMSSNITKPLNQLTIAATAISKGNYGAADPIKVFKNDELGKLAEAFNTMQSQVYRTWQELDEKVRERTTELRDEIKRRKVSEESLKVSSQKYHQLVEEVKDYAIIMLDVNGKVLVWNKGAEKIKGYKEDEIIGKSFACFYTKEDFEAGKPQYLLQKAAQAGRSEDEGWRVKKDGSKFWANVVFTAIYDNKGKLSGFAKITRDITEHRKLEEERILINNQLEERIKEIAIQSLQLETVNKELEAFSYSVSHDLRTPLRAINGYSIMLQEDYESKLDTEGKRILRNIISNARMMGQLIDDLLSFSRLGKKELAKTSVNMQLLVAAVVEELLQNEPENKYHIVTGTLPPVEADPVMIKQVMVNLIGNAIKYSSKKAGPEIKIGAINEDSNPVYYVKDNGAGFDMTYSGKLFGVFQRLHSQEEFEGTGVGLALVKRIIDKHKGRIWAEGVINGGATFYFSIPKN